MPHAGALCVYLVHLHEITTCVIVGAKPIGSGASDEGAVPTGTTQLDRVREGGAMHTDGHPRPSPSRPSSGPPRILLVDTLPERRAGLALLLEDTGMCVFGTASGTEALAILGLVQPDVAVVDLRVPDWDGLSLIRQLRRRRPALAVLAHSATDRGTVMPAAAGAGAVDVLDGRSTPDGIVRSVREAVRLSRTTDVAAPVTGNGGSRAGGPHAHRITP
jgi:CheY-like chemotaxis protein